MTVMITCVSERLLRPRPQTTSCGHLNEKRRLDSVKIKSIGHTM